MEKPILVKRCDAAERYQKEPLPKDTRRTKAVSPSYAIGLPVDKRKEVFNGLFDSRI